MLQHPFSTRWRISFNRNPSWRVRIAKTVKFDTSPNNTFLLSQRFLKIHKFGWLWAYVKEMWDINLPSTNKMKKYKLSSKTEKFGYKRLFLGTSCYGFSVKNVSCLIKCFQIACINTKIQNENVYYNLISYVINTNNRI